MGTTERDAPLDAVVLAALGALGAGERIDAWLAAACAQRGAPALAGDDPALLAALGVVSLRETARRWLAQAAEPPPATPDERGPAPRDLLR